MKEQSLKPVIEKLENYFELFNKKFFGGELLKPVITVSPDTSSGAYGWCTSWKVWADQEEEAKENEGFYEINMCAEYLARPFEETAGTLLHEMVHLYNQQHNIKDTSRSGNYHNKEFKKAAEAHGLTVEKDATYGWCRTKLDKEALEYVNSLKANKFDIHRKMVSSKAAKQSSRRYVCPCCGLIIRATKEVRISCMDCGKKMEAAI